jgi:DNA polymerase
MDAEAGAALRELVAAARAWVEEWAEEGVDAVPSGRVAARSGGAPSPALPSQATRSRLVQPASAGVAPATESILASSPATLATPFMVPGVAVRAALGECTRCRLCEGRTQIVFGDGNHNADILFVGEGPGEQEDLRGIPFCGRAGELLTSMIEKGMGLTRSEVYICNIVKC